jgi:hypothetical protein
VFHSLIGVEILSMNLAIEFNALRPGLIIEMVSTIKSLVPLAGLFKLKLDFAPVRLELKRNLVNEFARQREMTPPGEVLMALMLEQVLSSLEELIQLLTHLLWCGLIPYFVNHLFVHVVCCDCKRFGSGWCGYLLDKVATELVLDSGLLCEDRLWSQIKYTVVSLIYSDSYVHKMSFVAYR